MGEFTHLHVHTQYSLLDGAIRVKDLFPTLKARGMDAVAVTDHGNMFGAIDLYTEAKQHDIKVIFGCETYVAAADLRDRTNRRNYHLVLLAENETGYKNLSYLNSMGYLEGFYYNPRVDKALLRERHEGIIAMSACLGGEVAQTLAKGGVAEAEAVAREYEDIFGKGNFFLELMPTKTPEQQELNEALVRMGAKLDIPLVATNDCHYVNRADAAAHEVLMAIQTGKSLTDEKRMKHTVDSYYLKAPGEMSYYVFFIALIPFAQGLYFMFTAGLEFTKSPIYRPIISAIGLLTVVLFNHSLIQYFGVPGAAISIVLSWLMMAIGNIIYAQKLYKINYNWILIISITAAVAALGYFINEYWSKQLLLKIVFSVVFFCVGLLVVNSRYNLFKLLGLKK